MATEARKQFAWAAQPRHQSFVMAETTTVTASPMALGFPVFLTTLRDAHATSHPSPAKRHLWTLGRAKAFAKLVYWPAKAASVQLAWEPSHRSPNLPVTVLITIVTAKQMKGSASAKPAATVCLAKEPVAPAF
jgi:hypothetical protein